MEQRKKWSKISIALFVLAVIVAVGSRFLPKPAVEVESVVEQYLLTRTLFMLGAAVSAFLGLYVICAKLRCPHCGAFGLKQIQICGNCGKAMDAPVAELSEDLETVEEATWRESSDASEVIEAAKE